MNQETAMNETTQMPSPPMMMPISEQARIVEAVLFAATEPMSVNQLHAAIPGDGDVGAALTELQTIYAGRGVNLREIDGRWAFRTADIVAPHLYQFRREEKKLPRAALETLAIIAYHQPITRPEIENIRGVAVAKGTIDLLMEMGWVKPGKRREIPGRPLTWMTTPAFLDHFGLSALADLPGMDDLKASGLLDTRPAIDTIPDLFGAEDSQMAADANLADTDEGDDLDDDLEMLPSAITAFASVANQNNDDDDEEDDDDDTDAADLDEEDDLDDDDDDDDDFDEEEDDEK